MDLESGRPSPESMGKDDVTSAALLPNSDDVNKTETNGSCAHDICDLNSDGDAYEIPELDESANHAEEFGKLNSDEQADVKSRADSGSEKSNHLNSGEDVDALILGNSKIREIHDCRPLDSPSSPASTSRGVSGSSPLIATKGYGLKKWRRIKREFTKDGSPNLDSNKMLKRGLPCPVNFVDTSALPADMNPKSEAEASVSSTNALANSVGGADDFSIPGSNSVYRLESGSMFSAGTDSDNSEDRNSKSSTAASAPKSRYGMPKAIGYPREKYRMKNQSGRNLGNAGQLLQQGKGQVDTSKKPRAVKQPQDRQGEFPFQHGI
ncbi:hypothetical protein Nepgr_007732 [Nepenthes gracilis]|uniref:Uncharacterized protein n=1 Tax=Nepenthes gracilis TaxID=150966 RepID=A0AAD3XIJ1_NEPGR|nr:hypothetical protein Nepgr_007732 [Nepenthes gracilis]